MNSSRLLKLGVAAALIFIGAIVLAKYRTGGPSEASALLYPALKSETGNINAIRIYKGSDKPLLEILRKDEQVWTLTQRNNYPADVAKLRKLIFSLSDAKIIEEKTSNKESYAKLGVEDPNVEGASGVRIEMTGPKTPVNLIVGKQGSGDSAYVRRANEAASWQINTTFEVPTVVDAWLRRELLDISGERVQEATVAIGGKSYTASKSGRTDVEFKLDGIPKGKEAAPANANTFATALQGLALSEVRTAQEFGNPAPAATATFKTFDGLVAQLTGWSLEGNKRYVTITTSFDEATAKKFELPAAAAEPAKTEEGKSEQTKPAAEPAKAQNTPDKVREEANSANQRFAGWVFEIPAYKYDVIFKPVDQMLKR